MHRQPGAGRHESKDRRPPVIAIVRHDKMKTYDDIKEYRNSSKALQFADSWLAAQKAGQVSSDYHMNLLFWTRHDPEVVLAIVLNLIDRVGEDDQTAEMIAMGPVEWLVEHTDDTFTETLQAAIADHPGFALYTKGNRENNTDHSWSRLKMSAEQTAAASPPFDR